MKDRFPQIPEVADGHVLSATTLNAYVRGLGWLLGQSHGRFAAEYAPRGPRRFETTFGDIWRGWLYHQSATLDYDLWCGHDSAGKTWLVRLEVLGDDASWHTVLDLSGTDNEHRTGTVDLSPYPLTLAKIYQWRIQARSTDASYNSICYPWKIATRSAVTGWAIPPTFADGVPPDAAQFNTLRHDLRALMAFLPEVEPLQLTRQFSQSTHGAWETLSAASYTMRPDRVLAGVELESAWSAPRWRLMLSAGWGADPEVGEVEVYDSGWLPTGPWNVHWASIPISPTFGARIRLRIQFQHQSAGNVVLARRGFILRDSDQTPHGSWPAPGLFEHGDDDISAARLNALSDGLGVLHSGGEELWSEAGSCTEWEDEDSTGVYAGAQRRRWLIYRHADGATPRIVYGRDWKESYSLPTNPGWWLAFDLSALDGLLPGGLYYLHEATGAFESERIVGG
jgi:hypothetical protein